MSSAISEALFAGGGTMGALMQSYDWSQTALGPISQWSQSLKTAIRIMLTSRQPMWVWWGEDLVNLYNDAYIAILGVKHPQALGQPAFEVWQEIWDQVGPRVELVLSQNEGTYDESLQLIMKRRGYPEETYFTFSYSPIPNDQGEPGGILCANTEDTERVVSERQLALLRELAAETSEARTYDAACRLSLAGLATNPCDLPFAIIYLVNAAQTAATLAGTAGIEAHPAVPRIVDFQSQDSVLWPLAEVVQTNQPRVIDLPVQLNLPTGAWSQAPHQAVVVPIPPSGEMGQSGVLVAGLNPFRQFDQGYRGFIKLVAAQIAASIGNAQAYEEEHKRAEALTELDRAKTLFFNNISHEFRTPLTLMLGPTEDALGDFTDPLSPQQQSRIELVQRNGLRLLKLVNTLLDFSRIEAGRIQATYVPTDLASFTAELASLFRSAIERAGLRLEVDCPPLEETLLEPVYIDREMWEKIVLNLLSNAFKFTFAGKIRVQLRGLGSQVELQVQDSGIGIPAAELPHLFERFHQVRGAQGRSFEGSGIGLSLVRELVQLHGGRIAVTSTEGAGTCFTITLPTGTAHLPSEQISPAGQINQTQINQTQINRSLPLPQADFQANFQANSYVEEALQWLPETQDLEPIAAIATAGSTAGPTAGLTARILLVEDNIDMRNYVQRLLNPHYAVEAVGDGLTALSVVRQQQPDLVLTDVMMPELDGFGLLRCLRDDPQTREIPIILLSARAGEEAKVEGLAAGADDYLVKPFAARELLARVEATLKLSRLRQESLQQEQALRATSEAAQREAEAAYNRVSQILESMTDAFLALDRDWRILYQNAEAERLNGKPRSEVLGKTHWEAWPVSVGSELERQYRWAMTTQQPVHFEHHFSDLPGYDLWLEVHAYPSPEGLGIFFRDITARKLQEADLQEKQQFIQKIAETHPGVLYLFDLTEQRNRYLNHRTSDLLGYTPEQIYQLGEQFTVQVMHPDDQANLVGHFRALCDLQDGETIELEYQMRHQNGEWRWFWSQDIVFSRSSTGQPQQILGTALDITDRKQAELDLKQSEARYRSLAELIPQLVWTADAQGSLLDANQRWLDFTGITVAQAQTEGWQEIVHPDDLPHLSQQWAAAQQSGSRYRAEGRIRRVDGGYRWHLHQAIPLKTEQGEILKWFGTATDIEDQKQIQRQREELLQREQAAREQAETANRIKDEFLAVLSHELRSPLNPILGWSQLLQKGRLNPVQTQQALTTIERNAKLQSELIEDLLDVSRILQGKMSLNIAQVNLAETVQAAAETVRLAAEAKAIQIESQLAAVSIAGDPARLQQVVWNLLSNAIKFTPQGGRVKICLEPDQGQACLTVSDSGKGIDSAFLPHVFEYFRQENSATTRKFGGLGLGLAIVRHLVELHGGTITVESPGENQGATFTILLPLASVLTLPQPNPTNAPALDLTGVQVLVVDDDDDARDYVTFLLEQAGAKVIAVDSAYAALSVFNQPNAEPNAQPNILLSDIGMPDLDGYMLIRQIRAFPPNQGGQIPAIALTAYAGEINQQQALQAGFQTHLAKPIEPDTLIQAIASLVQGA